MGNLFNDIDETGIEDAKDSLGTGFIKETGLYKNAKIKMAYAGKYDSGARFFNITFTLSEGGEFDARLNYTNKNGDVFYMSGDSKKYLPDYIILKELVAVAANIAPKDIQIEERMIELWDKEAGERTRQAAQVAVNLLDKTLNLGIFKTLEDKTKDTGKVDESTKKKIYAPTGETFNKNQLDKTFRAGDDGRTYNELKAGTKPEQAKFQSAWEAKYGDGTYVKDNTDKKSGSKGGGKSNKGADKKPAPEADTLFND